VPPYCLVLMIVATVTGVIGFAGIAGSASGTIRAAFAVFLMMFVIAMFALTGRRREHSCLFLKTRRLNRKRKQSRFSTLNGGYCTSRMHQPQRWQCASSGSPTIQWPKSYYCSQVTGRGFLKVPDPSETNVSWIKNNRTKGSVTPCGFGENA
jgi:uncharacterized membrane protein YtjA (UPF0391 family)